VKIFQVDAFTAEPFRGNPAAVCLLDERRDEAWMQAVAAEMNLSETAFVDVDVGGPPPEGDGALPLRWFTPTVEVDLCGHATLATAHVLWEVGVGGADVHLRFSTRSGLLSAARTPDGGIELDFPADPPAPADPPGGLVEALGAAPQWFGRNRLGCVVELADAGTVRGLRPDLAALAGLPDPTFVVTAASDTEGYDFVSRCFAPALGISEDPVTGAAHCGLAAFWAARLGRDHLAGYQVSARGGEVGMQVVPDRGRVLLLGQAVTVFRGDLTA
jgi:predicted PhzF superfamily epimerase YddE/YHI9